MRGELLLGAEGRVGLGQERGVWAGWAVRAKACVGRMWCAEKTGRAGAEAHAQG